jgi:hypothetical protein
LVDGVTYLIFQGACYILSVVGIHKKIVLFRDHFMTTFAIVAPIYSLLPTKLDEAPPTCVTVKVRKSADA